MEYDTGAARTLMSHVTFNSIFKSETKPIICPTKTVLRKYGDIEIKMLGESKLNVKHQNKNKILTILIVNEEGPTLLGRDWIKALQILPKKLCATISNLHSVNESNIQTTELNILLDNFKEVFKPGLGTLKTNKVAIDVDKNVLPKFCKARPVPFSMKSKVEAELDRLKSEGIIESISHSSWACPIVPVLKPNGKIRICGDFRLTANRAIKMDYYPLPKPKEMLSTLAGGKYFAKLDLSQAYNQLEIEPESKKYTTINTHRGLFQYTRLCFGISSAPGIFQRNIENLLQKVDGVLSFSDDILISGHTKKEFFIHLKNVLQILQDAGLRLNREKCQWCLTEINYLGFKINAEGINPNADKVTAIANSPIPTNITELQAYLGLLNFYRSFLPKASTALEPLNLLLRSNTEWKWGPQQQEAFEKSKSLLINSNCLVHFDPSLPIVVSADCSSYGIGAVISHIIDGKERPISFASRTLTKTERNYGQVEREALALVYALKKFHFYVYGHPITLKTDHKPLLGIFNPDKAIPILASGRIQRWCLMLQAYKFNLVHTSGKLLGNADALSRLPLANPNETVPVPAEWINLVDFLDSTIVTAKEISKCTEKDAILSKVLHFTHSGWPTNSKSIPSNLKVFSDKKSELSIQCGCLLWGTRIVIPEKCQKFLLKELHSEHIGSTRMKQLARSYFWWHGLDSDIEKLVQDCQHCLEHRHAPPKTELHPWIWPEKPWHRIHIDYCGPIRGCYFLVLVDAMSKWVEIFSTKSMTSEATINLLRSCFARFGLPAVIVSDNAPYFVSNEFQNYLKLLGIKHMTSTVYKPSMNGLAERMVQTFKGCVLNFEGEGSMQKKLDQFLFKYRLTPHSTTGVSPAELMFGRRIRSVFDMLRPTETVAEKVIEKQKQMKSAHTKGKPRSTTFMPEDKILAQNYGKGSKWLSGKVKQKTGSVTYKCQLDDGVIIDRHMDQLWKDKRNSIKQEIRTSENSESDSSCSSLYDATEELQESEEVEVLQKSPSPPSSVRRSKRRVKPPEKLNL